MLQYPKFSNISFMYVEFLVITWKQIIQEINKDFKKVPVKFLNKFFVAPVWCKVRNCQHKLKKCTKHFRRFFPYIKCMVISLKQISTNENTVCKRVLGHTYIYIWQSTKKKVQYDSHQISVFIFVQNIALFLLYVKQESDLVYYNFHFVKKVKNLSITHSYIIGDIK